jgi:NAD(P)-dependent dehydrogenase (short-subunit alcohol dehydrogenase family)
MTQASGANWPIIRFDYTGHTVLVTGGTSGIGAGIAAAYRHAGAEVIITGTHDDPESYGVDLTGYRYLKLRLPDDRRIEEIAGSLPALDILINNAGGILTSATQSEYDPEIFELSLRINLTSGFRMARACRPLLSQSSLPGGASVIGIASMTSYFGWDGIAGYGAAKAALVQTTKTLGIAWVAQNIRVNAVAPGMTASRANARMLDDPVAMAPYFAQIPMRRVGTPRDVAGAVLFLTSPAAAYITGQTIPIDGGWSVSRWATAPDSEAVP